MFSPFFTYVYDGLYEAMWSEDTSGLSTGPFNIVSLLISAHPCHQL